MKIKLEPNPRAGLTLWHSEDGRFSGAITPPFMMKVPGEQDQLMPAGATLFVPEDAPNEKPTLNRYSPVVAKASSVRGLVPLLEKWTEENAAKSHWELRDI